LSDRTSRLKGDTMMPLSPLYYNGLGQAWGGSP
jgi:hypothetical protein